MSTFWDEGATGPAQIESSVAQPAQFFAIEIHPLLTLIMRARRLMHPNRTHIHILRTDLFALDPNLITDNRQLITLYLYVGPFVMNQIKKTLSRFPKNTRVLSYMYAIPGWEKKLVTKHRGKKVLYEYRS